MTRKTLIYGIASAIILYCVGALFTSFVLNGEIDLNIFETERVFLERKAFLENKAREEYKTLTVPEGAKGIRKWEEGYFVPAPQHAMLFLVRVPKSLAGWRPGAMFEDQVPDLLKAYVKDVMKEVLQSDMKFCLWGFVGSFYDDDLARTMREKGRFRFEGFIVKKCE